MNASFLRHLTNPFADRFVNSPLQSRVCQVSRMIRAASAVCALTMLFGFGLSLEAQTAYFSGVATAISRSASLANPLGIGMDANGDIFVADSGNEATGGSGYSTIWELTPAGSGTYNAPVAVFTSGASGPFAYLAGVVVDPSGNLWVTDYGCTIDPSSTFCAANPSLLGNLFELAYNSGTKTFGAPTAVGISGSTWGTPWGITADSHGNIFVADNANNRIAEVTGGTGPASALAGAVSSPRRLAVDANDNLYVVSGTHLDVWELTAPGYATPGGALGSVTFENPVGIAIDSSGNLWVTDPGANKLWEVPASSNYNSAKAWNAVLGLELEDVFSAGGGNFFLADPQSSVFKIATQGTNFGSVAAGSTSTAITLYFTFSSPDTGVTASALTQGALGQDFADAGSGSCDTNGSSHSYSTGDNCSVNVTFAPKYAGLRMGAAELSDASGAIATANVYGTGTGPQIAFEPAAITTLGGGFNYSGGLATDASGDVYVADTANNAVKKIPPGCASSSCVTVLGGGFSGPRSVAVDGAGNLYVADASNNAVKQMPPGCTSSSCVTTLGGGFSNPVGVAVDGSGNVYVGNLDSYAVNEMPPGCASSSCVMTLGGGFFETSGVAVDGSGNVYVADYGNSAVKEMPPGCASSSCVTTLGGGFFQPIGVAVDGSGNVYVADTNHSEVKEMPSDCTSSACVTTLGSGFNTPYDVAVDGSDNVYVADSGNDAVKELNAAVPPTLAFPTATAVGSTDTTDGTLTAQVFNIGNMPLVFSGLTYPTDFVEASGTNPCTSSTTLAAGQQCDVPVEFAPQIDGSPLSENVTLTNNNLNGSSVQQLLPLSGSGVQPGAATMMSPSPGSTFTSASTTFTWNTASGATAYYLWIGTTPGGYDLVNEGPFSGTTATVALPTSGAKIYVRLWTFINGGATQLYNDYTYTESRVAAGAITSPTNGSTLTSASTTFNWSAGAGSGITYYLWVGTSPGTANLVNIGPLSATSATVTLPTSGSQIYVRLWTFINGGATQLENDYTYTESSVSAAAITSPTNGSTLTGVSTTFNWSAGSGGTITYYLWAGTSPGTANLVDMGPLSGTSATVTLPANGTPVYVRLWTFINGGATQLENDYTYTEYSSSAAAITSPTNGSTLTGASTTFNWSAGSGGTLTYYLWVGTSPGTANLVDMGPLSGTSTTVTLPTNGTPIYVRLWTFINGGSTQLENDYSYTEYAPSAGVITSPTNGSTLAGASTTFNWSAGSGGTITYYLWVGTSPGGADVVDLGPLSGTSATVTLPTNGTPIYVRLWTFINGGSTQLENDYTYTEAAP